VEADNADGDEDQPTVAKPSPRKVTKNDLEVEKIGVF